MGMNDFMKWCWLLCLTVAAWEDWRTRQISSAILFIGMAVGIWSLCSSELLSHVWAGLIGLSMLGISKITRGALGEGDGLFFLFSACYWNVREIGLLFLGGLGIGFVWAIVLLMHSRWSGKAEKLEVTIPFLVCTWPVGAWLVCR